MQRNYRYTKDVLRHSAVYKKRRKVRVIKLVIFSILFLGILIGLIFVARMSTFTISEIQVKGLQSASTQDVINEIESAAVGNYAIVFPRKNVFFYPKDDIKETLLNKFSNFGDVGLKVVDTNKLEVTITEKNAMAVSCKTAEAIATHTFSDCFFIDSSAKVFQPVLGEPDQSLLRYVDENVSTASSTLSPIIMDDVQKVLKALALKNLVTDFIDIKDSKNAEFQLLKNGRVMISLPLGDDFISILDTALNTKLLAGGAKFEYIDARFGNKIFLKLGDGTGVSSAVGGTSTKATSSPTSLVKPVVKKPAVKVKKR